MCNIQALLVNNDIHGANMGKEQELIGSLEGLNLIINGFIEGDMSVEDAVALLKEMYPDNLSTLLDMYYDNAAVFYPFLRYPKFERLAVFLCEVNPTIITMPLTHDDARINLLKIVLQNKLLLQHHKILVMIYILVKKAILIKMMPMD